jgi:hypothetical protein
MAFSAWGPLESYSNRHKYPALHEEYKKNKAEEGAAVESS